MTNPEEKLIQFSCDHLEEYRRDVQERIREVLAEHAIEYVVGISGDADSNMKSRTETIVEEFTSHFQGGNYAILTGGTEGGVPQIGVETAKRLEIPTIGVFPKYGRKYALLHLLDLAIETSPPDVGDGIFGTETPTFVNMLDGATIIGGGYGTLAEVSTILKTNAGRARNRARNPLNAQNPIYFAPIATTGGAADSAYLITHELGSCNNSDLGVPQTPTSDGTSAAQFIIGRLKNCE